MGGLRANAERITDLRPRSSLPAGNLDQFVEGGLVVGKIAFRGRDLGTQPPDFVKDLALPVLGGTFVFRRPN
jgi:hypothetical protein